MFEVKLYTGDTEADYKLVLQQLAALIEGDDDAISVLANTSALLNQFLDNINWVGFYLWKQDELVLGPFHGLPACNRISYGKGVCGTALKEAKTLVVPDVEKFPGHIACDAASRSEIVIPLFLNGEKYGVLDIDSPILDRFDETDQKYLEQLTEKLMEHLAII